MERQSDRRYSGRARLGLIAGLILSGGLLASLGCQANGQSVSVAQAAEPPASGPAALPSDFDAERAHEDLVRLTEIGTRYDDARGASKARKHLKRGLSQSGFEVVEVETPIALATGAPSPDDEPKTVVATHLFARVEGDERDAILLVAPYTAWTAFDEGGRDATASASGPAVVLELARIDHRARRTGASSPMAWWIAMVDGDGYAAGESAAVAAASAPEFPGSDAFARWLAEQPDAQRIRLVVFVDRVGHADIYVARDLHSNRTYREIFFAEGAKRGHAEFAPDRPLSAPVDGQRAFVAHDITPVVAIIGEPLAPTESMLDQGVPDGVDVTSSASLFAVGDTVAAALARIGDRLARLDAFRIDPLRGGPGEIALPGSGEAGDEQGEADAPVFDDPVTPGSVGAPE